MIGEYEVLEAYRLALKLKRRRIEIENDRDETREEQDERLEAVAEHSSLELRYQAQFVS